jgi:hypothetical protein
VKCKRYYRCYSTARAIARRNVALLSSLLLLSTASAQDYSIDWFTIDGGGGASGGGMFHLSGTVGQPDAAPQAMTGGAFSLTGGFWSLFAVQTPGAPLLTIRSAGANSVIVEWPSNSPGFALQQSAGVNGGWAIVPQLVSDNGATKSVTVSPAAGNRFYRLFKP